MKIPHTIPSNTIIVYGASEETLELKNERYRTIRCEDLTWDVIMPMSLIQQSIHTIANNFRELSYVLPLLQHQDFDYLQEILSVNLPIQDTIPKLDECYYWQRCCKDRWGYQALDISKHRRSWKVMFVEKYVQEYIEIQEPGYVDWEDLNKVLTICAPFIYRLYIREMQPPRKWGPLPNPPDPCIRGKTDPEHLDMSIVLKYFSKLTSFTIRYRVRNCGMKYKPDIFKISITDIINLGAGLKMVPFLKVLHLQRCTIDDVRVVILVETLVDCKSLKSLEISHCGFGDIGTKSLAKLLTMHKSLRSLWLSDNDIREEGTTALAYALTQENCSPIRNLDLEFNPIGDNGAISLASAIAKNKTLVAVYMGYTGITSVGAIKIAEALLFGTVELLSFVGNQLDSKANESLINAVQNNKNIGGLDVRSCGIDEETELLIEKYATLNSYQYRIL